MKPRCKIQCMRFSQKCTNQAIIYWSFCQKKVSEKIIKLTQKEIKNICSRVISLNTAIYSGENEESLCIILALEIYKLNIKYPKFAHF
ncbi:hypothetical protein FKM82_021357 [Ascaphus truei]